MISKNRLSKLSVAGASFDSASIIRQANNKYLLGWRQVEDVLGIFEEDRLTALIDKLDFKKRHFVLTSPAIRASADELNIALEDGVKESAVIAKYSLVAKPLLKAVRTLLKGGQSDTEASRAAGFCVDEALSAPYPFLVSAWSPAEDFSSAPKFSERRSVQGLFDAHMATEAGFEPCVLREFSSAQIVLLNDALGALEGIDPLIARDIALNVRFVAHIDYARWPSMYEGEYREIGQSISSHLVPSCCFFSYHSFASVGRLAESLYHEALHKKLSNTLVAQPLLIDQYSVGSSNFVSYWNKNTHWNKNIWEFDRAFYAFHVYVHLAVFYEHLTESPSVHFPEQEVVAQRAKCSERANALSAWILTAGRGSLTPRGVDFCRQLSEFLPMNSRKAVNE